MPVVGDSQLESRRHEWKIQSGATKQTFLFLAFLAAFFSGNLKNCILQGTQICVQLCKLMLTIHTSTSLHQYIHLKPGVSEPIQSFMVLQPPPLWKEHVSVGWVDLIDLLPLENNVLSFMIDSSSGNFSEKMTTSLSFWLRAFLLQRPLASSLGSRRIS